MTENFYPLPFHRVVQHAPQVHIEAREDLLAAIDQRGVDAEAMKDVGEFDGDVAAALDHDRLRQFLEVEGFVGKDAMLVAGQCRMRRRAAAGGDENLVGGDGAVLGQKMHDMRVDQHGARLKRLAAGALHVLLVNGLQPADLAILVGDQRLPVESSPAAPSSHSRRHPAKCSGNCEA